MPTDIQTINPYIRVAMPSVLSAGAVIKQRVLFDYELIYIESGTFTLTYNGTPHLCRPGDFLLLHPGTPHSFAGICSDLSQPHLHFDLFYTENSPHIPVSFKDIDEFTDGERRLICEDVLGKRASDPFVTFSDKAAALEAFYAVTHTQNATALSRKAHCIQLLDMLIADNYANRFEQPSQSGDIARRIKDYIDAGQGRDATLDDLEKIFNYSKYHLERQFKIRYGISPIAYRNEYRLLKAQKLLAGHTVSAVAESVGFSSIYAFSRAFKQRFGVSPSEWKQHSERTAD